MDFGSFCSLDPLPSPLSFPKEVNELVRAEGVIGRLGGPMRYVIITNLLVSFVKIFRQNFSSKFFVEIFLEIQHIN
jgi:hypothetical protein